MSNRIDTLLPALKTILAEDLSLNLSADQIGDQVALMDGGLNLDSIVIIELIGIVEAKFKFQFQDADLRTATFENLRTLAEVISRRVVS